MAILLQQRNELRNHWYIGPSGLLKFLLNADRLAAILGNLGLDPAGVFYIAMNKRMEETL